MEQKQDFTHETTAVSSSQMPCEKKEKKKKTHTSTTSNTFVTGFIVSLTVMNAETTTFSDLPRKNVNIVKNLNYTQGLIAKSILVF